MEATTEDGWRTAIDAKLKSRPIPRWRTRNSEYPRKWLPMGERTAGFRMYGLHGFRTYRVQLLRGDYSELEMDLTQVFENHSKEPWFDLAAAEHALDILDNARGALEDPDPHADIVDADLGRVRRLLAQLTPPEWIAPRTTALRTRLNLTGVPEALEFTFDEGVDQPTMRFQMGEATGLLNRIWSASEIDNGLQLRRLEMVRNAGLAAALLLILFAPVLVNGASLTMWTIRPVGSDTFLVAWLTTIGVAVLGMSGALLSGLLQARDKPVTFKDYQVRGIEVALRALVGALVSVVLYYLLSWNVLPVVSVVSAGTFLLVAFVSGFSERYFLKLFGLEDDDDRLPSSSLVGRSKTPVPPGRAPANAKDPQKTAPQEQPATVQTAGG
jgi:hypothetical protein